MPEFLLLGHDNPFGKYPAPVTPVGLLDGNLVAIYLTNPEAPTAEPLNGEVAYVKHEFPLQRRLGNFEYHIQRLFAYGKQDVVYFSVKDEREFLRKFLADPKFNDTQPFLRLVLAKQTGHLALITREIGRCSERLLEIAPSSAPEWCASEMLDVLSHVDWKTINPKATVGEERTEAGAKPLIFIADDEPGIVDLFRMTFEKEGFPVSSAYNGIDAIEKIKRERPDLVVLDLIMPGLNGLDVLKRMRDDPELKDTKVIFVTAYANEKADQIVGEGAYICLEKTGYKMLDQLKQNAKRALKLVS